MRNSPHLRHAWLKRVGEAVGEAVGRGVGTEVGGVGTKPVISAPTRVNATISAAEYLAVALLRVGTSLLTSAATFFKAAISAGEYVGAVVVRKAAAAETRQHRHHSPHHRWAHSCILPLLFQLQGELQAVCIKKNKLQLHP
jgi:hypothetical protein